MEDLKSLYFAFMIIIPIATVVRVIYCVIGSSMNDDSGQYRKRAINAIVFCLIALLLYGIMGLFLGYFGKSFIF